MRPLALALMVTLLPASVAAQQLGERLPGQRAEPGMPRSAARADAPRPCPQYGPGFVRLEGSAACVRLGGHVRFEYGLGAGRGAHGSTSGMRSGAGVELDARAPTPTGEMRVLVRGRATSDTGAMRGAPWR
jgi:hypothetical protein